MSIPKPTFGPSGFIIPPESDVLVGVKGEINAAFANQLNMADETPQGQIAASQAAAIGNANDAFVFLSQQMDPAYNSGRYQDAIARIYFIERFPSRPTVASVTCVGSSGVPIPIGAVAIATDGNQYICVSGGTIPSSGSIALDFECSIPGPIPCPAGSINTIYQSINGWDSVDNVTDGSLGQNTETRQAFEQRRALSVAVNAQGSLPSVLGSVLSVNNVLDAFVTENVNSTPLVFGGVLLSGNSLYVAVVGGVDADVARAIWTKKSPGCGYNGNTSVVVEDNSPYYNEPYPAYTVLFERPAATTITFVVSLASNQSIPANATALIQSAIVDAFAGLDGGPRARIGDTIYASRFYAPISMLGAWVQIITIKLGSTNNSSSVFVGSITTNALTVSSVSFGAITVGQTIVGNGIVPGTKIISGTYPSFIVDTIQTVASGSISGLISSFDDVSTRIDQQPVVAPGDISVVLL